MAAELTARVPTLDCWRLQRSKDGGGGKGRRGQKLVCLPAGKSLSTVGSGSSYKEPGAAATSPPWQVHSGGKTNVGGISRWIYMPSSATPIRQTKACREMESGKVPWRPLHDGKHFAPCLAITVRMFLVLDGNCSSRRREYY